MFKNPGNQLAYRMMNSRNQPGCCYILNKTETPALQMHLAAAYFQLSLFVQYKLGYAMRYDIIRCKLNSGQCQHNANETLHTSCDTLWQVFEEPLSLYVEQRCIAVYNLYQRKMCSKVSQSSQCFHTYVLIKSRTYDLCPLNMFTTNLFIQIHI